jgi:hypothetical protein
MRPTLTPVQHAFPSAQHHHGAHRPCGLSHGGFGLHAQVLQPPCLYHIGVYHLSVPKRCQRTLYV